MRRYPNPDQLNIRKYSELVAENLGSSNSADVKLQILR